MADGTQLNVGTLGDKIDTEDFGARGKAQRIKVVMGDLDVDGGDLDFGQENSAGSLPVVVASDQSAVPISAASLPLPTGASTAAKQPALGTAGTPSADVISVQGEASMTPLFITGNQAPAAVVADNPVQLGVEAINAEEVAAGDGQLVRLVADLVGKLIVLPYANPENFISGALAADLVNTTSTQLIAAQAAGVRIYVTHIIVTNMHASVDTRVDILDGATVKYTAFAAHAGGGFSVALPVPLRGTAATALNVQCGTTGAQVRASASGYIGV